MIDYNDLKNELIGKKSKALKVWRLFPIPIVLVLLYFIFGFKYNKWDDGLGFIFLIPVYFSLGSFIFAKNKYYINCFFFVHVIFSCLCFLGYAHPGWLVYLLIPIYYSMRSAYFNRNMGHILYPLILLLAYLVFGFVCGLWHPTWIMFISIPTYYILCSKDEKRRIKLPFLSLSVMLYLIIGYAFNEWMLSVSIFIIPVVYFIYVLSKKKV